LLVGTDVGVVAAYDGDGDRYWRTIVSDTPDKAVIHLSASPLPPQNNQPAVTVTLSANTSEAPETAEVFLLDSTGRRLQEEPLTSVPGATRLVDVNQDGLNELLWASLGTLALADSGTGARKNAPGWDYRLRLPPRVVQVADVDQDGKDELLFGVGDGRVHMLDSDVGTEPRWLDFFGGDVPLLAVTRDPNTQQPVIVVVNTRRQGSETAEEAESTLRLLDGAGQPLSDSLTIPGQITTL